MRPGRGNGSASGDKDRPRAAKRQHAGKHARRHHHAVRRRARKVAHRGRRQRRADTPAWTRRSLGETGCLGSGQRGVAWFLLAAAARCFRRLVQPQRDDSRSPLAALRHARARHACGNGRTVDVRINDRGPFIGGRIIDLSRGAAGVLGMTAKAWPVCSVTVLGR